MFTGIIESIGQIAERIEYPQGLSFAITTNLNLDDVKIGDSIAVNGVCLTVTKIPKSTLWFDIGPETLAKTTLGSYQTGRSVNLEKAMLLSSRISGHLVQGHVDGVGHVLKVERRDTSLVMTIGLPKQLAQLCIPKGSITVDGVSLTINDIGTESFQVCLIPHTLTHTTLNLLSEGDALNLETDLLGKHVFQWLSHFEGFRHAGR